MKDGSVEQLGAPAELYDFPKTQFVASFLQVRQNLINVTVLEAKNDTPAGDNTCCTFKVKTAWDGVFNAFGRVPFAKNDAVMAAVRAEGVRIKRPANGEPAPSFGTGVGSRRYSSSADSIEYRVRVNDQVLRSRCDRAVQFTIGDQVGVELVDRASTILAN